MKASTNKVLVLLFGFVLSNRAQNPEWMNFAYSSAPGALCCNGDDIWIGSHGGLIQMNRFTGERTMYNSASGLPGLSVNDILFDIDGKLWAAVWEGGIASFDSESWTVFNPENGSFPSEYVWCLHIDKQGVLWAGTSIAGLCRYNGHSWESIPIEINDENVLYISDIIDCPTGGLWLGTSDGLIRYDDGICEVFSTENMQLPCNRINMLAYDQSNRLWIALGHPCNLDGGLVCLDGGDMVVYSTLNSPLPHDFVYELAVDDDGGIWAATFDGLTRFKDDAWTAVPIDPSFGYENETVSSVLIDPDGGTWAGVHQRGLGFYDGESWIFHSIATMPGIEWNDGVHAIAFDAQGTAWLGTRNDKALMFDGSTWKEIKFSSSEYEWEEVTAILPSAHNQDVFIACEDRLLRVRDGELVREEARFGSTITAMAYDGLDRIWVGTRTTGLYRCESVQFEIIYNYRIIRTDLPSNAISSLCVDKNNNLWIGTNPGYLKDHFDNEGGVASFDGVYFTQYNYENSSLQSNQVSGVACDSGNRIWVTTHGHLHEWNGTEWTLHPVTVQNPPKHLSYEKITIDHNDVKWIGGSYGLYRYDGTDWKRYTTVNSGLPENMIESMAVDAVGNLWIGTANQGFAIYKEGGVVGDFKPYESPVYSIPVQLPQAFRLMNNYPNPFNSTTIIPFQLSEETNVTVDVFDLRGRLVRTLIDGRISAGFHHAAFNATGLSSGPYFFRMQAGNESAVKRMLFVR